MTNWPKNESATGRGFTQGSDSYRADDVAREERECKKEREREIRHIYSDDDPNFGDYNIPPCGNHP